MNIKLEVPQLTDLKPRLTVIGVVGMVTTGLSPASVAMRIESNEIPPQGYLGRVGQWLMTGL